MPPLNPFLRAFFRSALPSQCSPPQHHVLLVPTTDVLLNAKDRESNTIYADLVNTEEFLASHVLRVPGGMPPGTDGAKDGGSMRDQKSKAKQYSTANGRTVIVKDTFVYGNKGFKTFIQAQLLSDSIYYPDSADGQQWLVYFISKPLIGSIVAVLAVSAVISDAPSVERRKFLAEATGSSSAEADPGPPKKEIKSFGDLMMQYPMIARQVQGGIERSIRDFVALNERPVTKTTARRSSVSSQSSTPSISSSITSLKSSLSDKSSLPPTAIELEADEEAMRTSLESTVTSAIELFQKVDKSQLALLGTDTELTGDAVERMIERYVAEQIHDKIIFPRICAIRKLDDFDLDSKIRKMSDVDVAQVGIPIEDDTDSKRQLTARLAKGIEAFKRMGTASSPQEMLGVVLKTQKMVTETASATSPAASGESPDGSEKTSTALTVNADILVSMLLVVVIRSGVRQLYSRLLCMRYFIFYDEVESGENGYALATLEAVLTHLSGASANLRKASQRNRILWRAVKAGDMTSLRNILQPTALGSREASVKESSREYDWNLSDEDHSSADDASSGDETADLQSGGQGSDYVAVNGSLDHVFPFHKPPTPPLEEPAPRAKKRVSMAALPRSRSMSSGYSSPSRPHSRHQSIDSGVSTSFGGDLSTETVAQTQDSSGNSVLMMAVEAGQHEALKFLLAMPAHFRVAFVLTDVDAQGATLLNAAVQSTDRRVIDELIVYLDKKISEQQLAKYLALRDIKGRCVAHYLFNHPYLLRKLGRKLPWRLQDNNGQTPLFALCRSYDHEQYRAMVDMALALAVAAQGDGEPLHLDDHIDAKGNTLLHIVNDPQLTLQLLRWCDSDVNASNDKRFTPLMVGSKYGRVDLVRALFGDPRVDLTLKDIRGLTAVELAKDDDVRNRFDDLVLLSNPAGPDERTTTLVRSYFVEDATIRFVMKSGAPSPNGMITVTTCRRSIADFENLAKWLSVECPASWLPTNFNLPSALLLPSKPSRAVLRDVQLRLDGFFRTLLTHATFANHELVWEFFLVPEIDTTMLMDRSERKAQTRLENIRDDYEPVTNTQEVETFVTVLRDQIHSISTANRKVVRALNRFRMAYADLFEASALASARLSAFFSIPPAHRKAFERYTKTLPASESSPMNTLYYTLHTLATATSAIETSLDRPAELIHAIARTRRLLDRKPSRPSWTPSVAGLFEDSRKAIAAEQEVKQQKAKEELEILGCELRYTQQTVAGEVAVWQDVHARELRQELRRLARGMVIRERDRLEGMRRALRVARGAGA